LEEVRRRTKVMGRFPGETSCLSLCWAVPDMVVSAAHGLGPSDIERQQLHHLQLAKTAALQPESLAA
jgi:putative transposase